MSSHHLEYLLAPRSVAVIGASDRASSLGATVIRNLLAGGFRGPVWPVNLHRESVAGERAWPDARSLPGVPDLAVLCTRIESVPGLVTELGALGTRAAVVACTGDDAQLARVLAAARRCGLRLLGPGSLGVLVPGIGLDASAATHGARAGGIAFVSQSGALLGALLDWGRVAGVGFSHCVALGGGIDVDAGDLLDYLGKEPRARAILLCLESLRAARKFMSAARAAARNKPVIALRAGRAADPAGAVPGVAGPPPADAVWDAALRRAGVLRVDSMRELFTAAQLLSRDLPCAGARLAIVSNGRGPALAAADALLARGGELARPGAATLAVPGTHAPPGRAGVDPLDIGGDATADRYAAVVAAVLADTGVDAVLVIHAPVGPASAEAVAHACAPLLERSRRPAFACWLGHSDADAAAIGGGALTGYATPEEAVAAFMHVVRYHQAQALLVETPRPEPEMPPPDLAAVRAVIGRARAQGRSSLGSAESLGLLAAAGVPVATGAHAAPPRAGMQPLRAALACDPTFGPVVTLGRGGAAADGAAAGRAGEAVALPPLNAALARELIGRARIGCATGPGPRSLAAVLVSLGELACEPLGIAALEVDPLLADADGVFAAGARVQLAAHEGELSGRLAICPYPAGLEERIRHGGRALLLRPIRPEDAPRHRDFLRQVTPQDLYTRFFTGVREVPDADIAHLTQIDYDREMAFLATTAEGDGAGDILGVARACTDPGGEGAEFAVLVRSDLKGRGLGTLLMRKLIAWCRERGVRRLWGSVLAGNGPMLRLARDLGFAVGGMEGNVVEVTLDPAAGPGAAAQRAGAGGRAAPQTTLE